VDNKLPKEKNTGQNAEGSTEASLKVVADLLLEDH
jgi:hypothetical protein